ncbi:MAG: hypothetical protein KDA87_15430 [Planctomycetales bacterium]|nr:hypothetical protein [Planctomycetales bacterium]
MKKNDIIINEIPSFENFESKVLKFVNMTNPLHIKAIQKWRDSLFIENEKIQIVHECKSQEVFDALCEYFRTEIEEEIFLQHTKLLKLKLLHKMIESTSEHEGKYVNSEDDEIFSPHHFGIIKPLSEEDINSKLIYICGEIINQSDKEASCDLESLYYRLKMLNPGFKKDFEEILKKNGDKGKSFINEILYNLKFAEDVVRNVEVLKPLRYLAAVVIENRTQNKLPEINNLNKIGF